MEAVGFPEELVPSYKTARCHILVDSNLHVTTEGTSNLTRFRRELFLRLATIRNGKWSILDTEFHFGFIWQFIWSCLTFKVGSSQSSWDIWSSICIPNETEWIPDFVMWNVWHGGILISTLHSLGHTLAALVLFWFMCELISTEVLQKGGRKIYFLYKKRFIPR